MAFVHGRNARVYFNAVDLSAYMTDANLAASMEPGETTTFGASAKAYLAGLRDKTFDFAGNYDPAATQMEAALAVDAGVLTYCPGGGAAIGDLAWLGSVIGTEYDQSSPVGGIVAFSWAVQASAGSPVGYVLHPLAEDTNTTTGATRDDTAATTTGWAMHLHVPLVDAGSWVIKLQDASASNFSDVADVTGGSFTAATAATQQRLVSAVGATLRRYVRYTATRTGGAGGDGITFQLSLSRTYPA